MENYYLEIAIGIAALCNILASIAILRSDSFEKAQKVAQIIIVWLIPFVASIGITIFIISEDKPKLPPSAPGGGSADRISQME